MPVPEEKRYPPQLVTIGDHIRKRRLDAKLTQLELARRLGVKEGTVWTWEKGVEPKLRYMPEIIDFLGYAPFPCPEGTLGRLAYFKRTRGMSYKGLGKAMMRSHEQVNDWLSGRIKPFKKSLEAIDRFLAQEGM